jgi:hypothetical protein
MKMPKGLPGSIERTCGEVQKLTGEWGVLPKVPSLGGGGAAQNDAQQTRRAPGAHHFIGVLTAVPATTEIKMDP